MEVLQKGTIESLLVAMRDRLSNISTLASVSNLKFDTKRKDDGLVVQSNIACVLDPDFPMTAICEIDTTLVGYVGGEEYKLYLKWTSGSDNPVKGPIFFRVEAD